MNRYVLSSYDLFLFQQMVLKSESRNNWTMIIDLENDNWLKEKKVKLDVCPNCGTEIVSLNKIGEQDG